MKAFGLFSGFAFASVVVVQFAAAESWKQAAGYCLGSDGFFQHNKAIKLDSIQYNGRENYCLEKCKKFKGATGCEVVVGWQHKGCYVYTGDIAKGSREGGVYCWIKPKPKEPEKPKPVFKSGWNKQKGFCIQSNGADQNSGVKKLNGNVGYEKDTAQAKCLKLCEGVKDATGCEVIWNQSNKGCYAHTHAVARGNGAPRHSCWIKTN